MCGITGIVLNDINQVNIKNKLETMCDVINHRGPDHTGVWINNNIGIGMTRLSIIDRAGGSQPIHNEDKSLWIVYNGEIYNFKQLQKDLKNKGHRFYTESDTETIIHLYEEYGKKCVEYLRGMFAFAIWDKKNEELFIARDRLGIKPLHYSFQNGTMLFGSEIKSILASGLIDPEVSPQDLVYYFFYGYTPDPGCLFKGIRKLPPGHYLTFRRGLIEVEKYWDVQYKPDYSLTETDCIEQSLQIMKDAVKMRLVSEVPLGAFLSGGIDSSLVVALMAQQMSEPVKTFSIGFEEQKYNELEYARMVAERYETEHHEEIVRADAEEVIEDLIHQFDEPFADSSAIPTYYVSKMTKKHVTVSLSGDGGDEVFAGYSRYQVDGAHIARYLPGFLKKGLNTLITGYLPLSMPGLNTLTHMSLSDEEQIVWKYTKMFSPFHKRIFTKDFARNIETDPSGPFAEHLEKVYNMDRLTRLQYLDKKTYLPGDILTKIDRMSMLVSLEARVPLLDHQLVEFAAKIPHHLKMKNGETKYLLKKIAEKLLPPELIYRKKQGFAVPIGGWIKKEWKEMSRELILGERALSRGIFQESFSNHIMTEHQKGRRDNSYLIWTLMVLEMWFRKTIDRCWR